MFGLSTLWVRLIGIGALLAALLGGLGYVYSKGYDAAETKFKLELANAKIDADAQAEVLQESIDKLSASARKKDRDAQNEISRLRVAIDDGSLRFSAPLAVTGGSSTGPAAQPTRGELDRPTTQALLGITADGDQAIRELNQCLAAYNEVKEKQNGNRPDRP